MNGRTTSSLSCKERQGETVRLPRAISLNRTRPLRSNPGMNTKILGLLAAVSLGLSSVAFAATKDYQVTGPVTDVSDSMITVEKGKEKWEIARDSNTKASGEVKKGDKVTVHYTMTATSIESKAAEKGAKKEEKKK